MKILESICLFIFFVSEIKSFGFKFPVPTARLMYLMDCSLAVDLFKYGNLLMPPTRFPPPPKEVNEKQFGLQDFGKTNITASNDLNEETLDALNKQNLKYRFFFW